MLHPIALRAPDRIVVMWETAPERNLLVREVSYRNFIDWRDQSQTFDGMAAIGSVNWSLLRENSAGPARVPSAAVSAAFFDVLGVSPALGRSFVVDDDRRGAARVVILSHRLWQREFGADPGVVSTTVRFDGQPFTIPRRSTPISIG